MMMMMMMVIEGRPDSFEIVPFEDENTKVRILNESARQEFQK